MICVVITFLPRDKRLHTICHYIDVIMTTMASQITSLMVIYSIFYSGADQRKHQSSASLTFVQVIHRCPVNSPNKGPVTRKMFPFDDVIMVTCSPTGKVKRNTDGETSPDNALTKLSAWYCRKYSFKIFHFLLPSTNSRPSNGTSFMPMSQWRLLPQSTKPAILRLSTGIYRHSVWNTWVKS